MPPVESIVNKKIEAVDIGFNLKESAAVKPCSLVKNLKNIIDTQSTSPADFAKLNQEFDILLENYEENIEEIGRGINLLYCHFTWRHERLIIAAKRLNLTNSRYNAVIDFVTRNFYNLNHESDPQKQNELYENFINHLNTQGDKPPSEHEKKVFSRAWKTPSRHHQLLKSFYYESIKEIKAAIQEQINKVPENISIDLTYFSKKVRSAHQQKNYGLIAEGYTEKDFKHFKKTIFYLTSSIYKESSPKTIFALNLYYQTNIRYTFDGENLRNAAELIKDKKGDCSEFVVLAYSVLKSMPGNNPEVYLYKRKNIEHTHAFIGLNTAGAFYLFDNEKIIDDPSFASALKTLFPYRDPSIQTIRRMNAYDILNINLPAPLGQDTGYIQLEKGHLIQPR